MNRAGAIVLGCVAVALATLIAASVVVLPGGARMAADPLASFEDFLALDDAELETLQVKLTFVGSQTKPTATVVFTSTENILDMDGFLPYRRPDIHYGNDEIVVDAFVTSVPELRRVIEAVYQIPGARRSGTVDGEVISYMMQASPPSGDIGFEAILNDVDAGRVLQAILDSLDVSNVAGRDAMTQEIVVICGEDGDGDGVRDMCDPDDDEDGYWDVREVDRGSDLWDANSTPEVCDGVDNDGDTLTDEDYDRASPGGGPPNGVPDCSEDVDTDGDTILNPVDEDDDNDGFTDGEERWISTDELADCATDYGTDAWPPDIDNNTRVNILDVLLYKPKLTGAYDARYDLNADRKVNILDVLLYKPELGASCTGL